MRFFLHAILIPLMMLTCVSSPPSENDTGTAFREGEFALILAEQESEGDLAATPLRVTALFLHHRGMPFDGIAQFFKIPIPPAAMAAQIDQCDSSPLKDDSQWTIEEGFVELLDAGVISIRMGAETRSLISRPFPDIVANIVGSIYQTEFGGSPDAIPTRRQTVDVESTGSAEVGRFSASIEIPSSFKFVSNFPSRIDGNSDLTVQWSNADPKSDYMMLKIVSESGKVRQFFRCFVKDDGEFQIPAKLISQVEGMKSDQPLKIYGYRVKTDTFSAIGMETGLIMAVKSNSIVIF